MAVSSHQHVSNADLDKWESVASGGFGHVYKARHKGLGFDVAIKILRLDICPVMSLMEEAAHMDKASCEFVLRRYGSYHGCPPHAGPVTQNGIVMEFMERGSVESLLRVLSGPPPWPLVFRLAHQVALGMNFLHFHGLMHHDLKPSNVLLTVDLNAKLADFGLCRVSTSAGSREISLRETGGTYKYMPPEAFKEPYEPHRSYDVYSYGILLWSIVTGKEPYGTAGYDHVEVTICDGQRPSLLKIDQNKAEGLEKLVDLIKKCWDGSPSNRPLFIKCCEDTENLFSKHKGGIHEAVQQVSARLPPTNNQQSNTHVAVDVPPQTQGQTRANDIVDFIRFTRTERPSAQYSVRVPAESMSIQDKAKFVDANRAEIISSIPEVMSIAEDLGDMVPKEAYSWIAAQLTRQDQMRALYNRPFHSGGEVVKAAFYDALKNHHPELVKRLGGILKKL